MSKNLVEFLKHIRDECQYLLDTSKGVEKGKFMHDLTLQKAFSRSLEIIGKAAKNIPADFRVKHNEIDWKAMAGMRDRLIHGYFGVDYEIVWDVVVNEIPFLNKQIAELLKNV